MFDKEKFDAAFKKLQEATKGVETAIAEATTPAPAAAPAPEPAPAPVDPAQMSREQLLEMAYATLNGKGDVANGD